MKRVVILAVIMMAIFGGGLRSLSAVEYIYRYYGLGKRSDYRTFGLSNLRTIDTEPHHHDPKCTIVCRINLYVFFVHADFPNMRIHYQTNIFLHMNTAITSLDVSCYLDAQLCDCLCAHCSQVIVWLSQMMTNMTMIFTHQSEYHIPLTFLTNAVLYCALCVRV